MTQTNVACGAALLLAFGMSSSHGAVPRLDALTCAHTLDGKDFEQVGDRIQKLGDNILNLNVLPDADSANAFELESIAARSLDWHEWISDLAHIAAMSGSPATNPTLYSVLTMRTKHVLRRLEIILRRTNQILSRIKGTALVAEGRELRDALQNLSAYMAKCGS